MTRKRVNNDQNMIINELEKAGASVFDLHEVGRNLPDLLVSCPGSRRTFLIEVITEGKKLSPGQAEWQEKWPGKVYNCYTITQALQAYTIENFPFPTLHPHTDIPPSGTPYLPVG